MLDRVAGKLALLLTGLAANTGALQRNREALRVALQATLASSEALHAQREHAVALIAREFELSAEDAGVVYDGLRPGWTAKGKPDTAALQLEFEMDQRELELPEPIRPEQVFDFSLLDEAQARP